MTPILFAAMIIAMVYAVGTSQFWLFILAWWGGSWLIALSAMERGIRADGTRRHRPF